MKRYGIMAAMIGAAAVGVLGGAAAQPEKRVESGVAQSFIQLPSPSEMAFDRLKALVGTWRGKASHGGEPFDTEVTYRLTGNGSALVETIMPGTDHEMVSIYTRDRDTLLMTHYCTMGNQPRMRCTPGNDVSTLKFEFIDGGNMAEEDMHMHSLVMKFEGADTLTATWAMYDQGKPHDEAKFVVERVKGSAPDHAPTPTAPKHDHGK